MSWQYASNCSMATHRSMDNQSIKQWWRSHEYRGKKKRNIHWPPTVSVIYFIFGDTNAQNSIGFVSACQGSSQKHNRVQKNAPMATVSNCEVWFKLAYTPSVPYTLLRCPIAVLPFSYYKYKFIYFTTWVVIKKCRLCSKHQVMKQSLLDLIPKQLIRRNE